MVLKWKPWADPEYWKSAIINQSAHVSIGFIGVTVFTLLTKNPSAALWLLFVIAWIREFWQAKWDPKAVLRWRKWNDVAWFMVGGWLAVWLTSCFV